MAYNNNYQAGRRSPGNQIVAAGNGAPAQSGEQKLSAMYLGSGAVNLVKAAIGDEKAARRVLTTVLTVVQKNPKLQECSMQSVLNAALDGEVTKNLSLANGEYAIVPYKGTATMQLMVNGIKKMAIRSCAYADTDCYDVREGEFKGYDAKTRRPIIEWITDADRREELPIVGYYAFYELNDDYNHFFKSLYWTHQQILRHADRYSPAFSLATWKKLMAGEITGWDAQKLRNGSSWYGEPDDMAHMKMCKKTVIKQLLNDGFAPKEIDAMLRQDDAVEQSGEPIIRPEDIVATFAEAPVPAKAENEAELESNDPSSAAQSATPSPQGEGFTGGADFSARPAASVEMTTGTEERIAAVPAEPRNDGEEAPKRRGRPPKNAESKEQAFSMFDEG